MRALSRPIISSMRSSLDFISGRAEILSFLSSATWLSISSSSHRRRIKSSGGRAVRPSSCSIKESNRRPNASTSASSASTRFRISRSREAISASNASIWRLRSAILDSKVSICFLAVSSRWMYSASLALYSSRVIFFSAARAVPLVETSSTRTNPPTILSIILLRPFL